MSMLYLAVGATGFLSVVLYDLAQIHEKRAAALALSSIGYVCILASIVFLILGVQPPTEPVASLIVKLFFAAVFSLLLIYSVAIEIPLALRRKGGRDPAQGGREVVAVGFYGVVRHPGFLWFTLLWVSISLIYLNPLVTLVGLGLVFLDLVLVVVEDLVFFPRMFAGYDQYKRRVPFLLPHLKRD